MMGNIMLVLKRISAVVREGGAPLFFKKVFMRFIVRSDKNFFFHLMPKGHPVGALKLITLSPEKKDVIIAERIMTAFHKAFAEEQSNARERKYVDAWDDNRNEYQDELIKILHSHNPESLVDYLSSMHRRKSTYGVSGNITEYRRLQRNSYLRKKEVAGIKDVLVSFAEALGVLPYETVVPHVAKKNIYENSDFLVGEIENKLGIKIAPPEVEGGLFKLGLKSGSFDHRDMWSLYLAWRIKNFVSTEGSIGEIGGGLGKAALYSSRFGLRDYSIFDLPIMNVMTAWHLIKALPNEKVVLYGEPQEEKALRILPYWIFPDKKFDMIVNQDSLPEIGEEIVKDYLGKIKNCSRYFLSINHEHQAPLFPGSKHRNLVIPRLIHEVGGFTRTYRFPFWLRKGYVEELYEVEQ